jgi:hypothetical protein
MANTLPEGLETLAGAWREFQTCAPVKLEMVQDDRHYDAMVDFLNNLIDEIGDREAHPLMGLLDIVGCFVREYEESNTDIPDLRRPAADEDAPEPKTDCERFRLEVGTCRQRDSNPRPPDYKSGALPTVLCRQRETYCTQLARIRAPSRPRPPWCGRGPWYPVRAAQVRRRVAVAPGTL